MRLTDHFTLDELIASETAARRGIDNDPPPGVIDNLKSTAEGLEQIRSLLGDHVVSVSSGYRSPELNMAVGGSVGSAHRYGFAADFNVRGYGSPLQVCEAIERSGLRYDQVIHEFGRWVHVSFDPRMRRQSLTIDRLGTRLGLHPVR